MSTRDARRRVQCTPAPDRHKVETVLGVTLLDWQWTTLLGIIGHTPVPSSVPETLPKLAKPLPLAKLQDQPDFQHTCIVCGRTGSRRFVLTTAGWRCTAYDVCERRAAEPKPVSLSELLDSRVGIS